jgi:CBS domain containing-hemolysin-like protein
MMWFLLIGLLLLGVFLSAFFSGSETGFYRVTRVRLAMDAMSGDTISRMLLWLTNNPSLFVATCLVGNNLANYMTSLAIVLGTRGIVQGESFLAELIAPIALAPLLFVYGELMPKNMYFVAPNKLLRKSGPLFGVCGILFCPISLTLWILGRFLQWIAGEAPALVRLRLARDEIQAMLEEGSAMGMLRPAQGKLAQGLFTVANGSVSQVCVPAVRMTAVYASARKSEVLRVARRHRSSTVLVNDHSTRRPRGYISTIDLYLCGRDWESRIRPLTRIPSRESQISALIRLRTAKERLAIAVDEKGHEVGIVSAQQLMDRLVGG